MAGQRSRFFGWYEPCAHGRKHGGAQLTASAPETGFKWAEEANRLARVGPGG